MNDLLALHRITTNDNYSDAMTKALGKSLFYRHTDYIMGKVIPTYCLDHRCSKNRTVSVHASISIMLDEFPPNIII